MWKFLSSRLLSLSLILGLAGIALAQPVEQSVKTCCPKIQEYKLKYLAEHQYNEFIKFLSRYKSKDKAVQYCLDYYKADTRYLQLKHLEETQSWDDYFSNGNTYRQQLVESARKVIEQTLSADCLKVKSRFLLWQFHRDQQDVFVQEALEDLVAQVKAYAQDQQDPELIKEIADQLLASQEKSKAREIYKLYVDGLVRKEVTTLQLKNIASGFYNEGNLELAQSIYDLYIEKVTQDLTSENLVKELLEIAGLFVYKASGPYDMAYAEKIYALIDSLGQENVFDQEAIYLRAFNLEKFRAYQQAGGLYLQLTQTYPETQHFDEAIYKVAMINAYVLADLVEARRYFELIASRVTSSPQTISSLYQLGLLSHWQGDLVQAGSYYNRVLEAAGDQYKDIVSQAQERIKEIQENQPISYNLKTFLDLSLNKESALIELNRAELQSAGYILEKNQNNSVSSLVSMPQSGCNQVELQYLWSGNLGAVEPEVTESNFDNAYLETGTKEINIVIISPAGAIDRSFMMLDVY